MVELKELGRLISPGDKVLAGVSGGADSMAMLHFLYHAGRSLGFTVAAVTVNHNLRGGEGADDVALVEEFCAGLGVEAHARSVRISAAPEDGGLNIESEARRLRYAAFREVAAAAGCNKIATAHHAQDNAETILMNLFRGSGARGASGIAENAAGCFLRPLINTDKAEILRYVRENRIPYREDSTNADTAYSRNYLRREVLPLITARWPGAVSAVNRFGETAREDEELICSLLGDDIVLSGGAVKLPLYYLKYRALSKRAAARAFTLLGADLRDVSAANYGDIYAMGAMPTGARVLLPHGITALRDYEYIVFTREKPECYDYEIPFAESAVTLPTGRVTTRRADRAELRAASRAQYAEGERVLYAGYRSIPEDAVWRTRREGDRIVKFGGGTKQLNDYMAELKIPQRLRDSTPVLAQGGKILLIAGYEISERLRAEDDEIIAVCYKKNS